MKIHEGLLLIPIAFLVAAGATAGVGLIVLIAMGLGWAIGELSLVIGA